MAALRKKFADGVNPGLLQTTHPFKGSRVTHTDLNRSKEAYREIEKSIRWVAVAAVIHSVLV